MDFEADLKTCNVASCHGAHLDSQVKDVQVSLNKETNVSLSEENKGIKNVPHEQSESTNKFKQKIKKLLKQSSGGGIATHV